MAEGPAGTTGGRDLALDGLRGFAVAIVVWGHTTVPWVAPYPPFPAGWFGVEVFFALSGYLITRTLLADAGPGALPRFWTRRFCRIVPAFAVLAVVCLLVFDLRHPLALVTYTLNFALALHGRSADNLTVGHVWSLCVEEHFYLLWPLLVLGLRRPRLLRTTVAVILGSFGLAAAFAWLAGRQGVEVGRIDDAVLLCTPFRVGTLMLGAIPALRGVRFGDRRMLWPAAIFLVAGFALPGLPDPYAQVHQLVSQSLLASGLFYAVLSGLGRGLWSWRPLTDLGRISYGVYLAHVPVLWGMGLWGGPFLVGPDATGRVLQAYVLILALAWLSFTYFESPIIRWGHAVTKRMRLAAEARTPLAATPPPAAVIESPARLRT